MVVNLMFAFESNACTVFTRTFFFFFFFSRSLVKRRNLRHFVPPDPNAEGWEKLMLLVGMGGVGSALRLRAALLINYISPHHSTILRSAIEEGWEEPLCCYWWVWVALIPRLRAAPLIGWTSPRHVGNVPARQGLVIQRRGSNQQPAASSYLVSPTSSNDRRPTSNEQRGDIASHDENWSRQRQPRGKD
ncbi:uncharacterized protein BKA78DRAFT_46903 [Phyllosticta capitalensis]|uniref:uncharacterized protein n=1 Tax=Phyllosticta capitalensis TaxID=121624 RepID=UPI00313293A9